MSHAHTFFIPNVENLIDMVSLLKYLDTILSAFHECLCCGRQFGSLLGVQDHMKDMGHCRLNFERDDLGLAEFWDSEAEEGSADEEDGQEVIVVPDDDDNELRLPSGKALGHRSHARHPRRRPVRPRSSSPSSRDQQLRLQDESGAASSSTERDQTSLMQLESRRPKPSTSTSLIGVPELQLRALMVVEKKSVEQEIRQKNEFQSGVERGGNKQKRFRARGIGKKQGGLEKRLG